MKSFVVLSALILAVCFASGQCRSSGNRNTNINTNTNTNTNGDFLSSYLNSMMDQERKGKAIANQKQSGSTVLCLVCPKCCAVRPPIRALAATPAAPEAQQEDQLVAEVVEAPPAAEADESIADDEASEPRQERSATSSAQQKFFKSLMVAKALKSKQHQ